jgi:membrane protein DedA with SNARE-associated domain
MFEEVAHTVVDLVETYGFLVIFVFMFLESSMVFPLIPSEIVVPSTAAILVEGPLSFAVFVLAATAGSTIGCVFAYYVFGGTSHFALERYGEYIRVSDAEIDQAQRWFNHWGESSVFWSRFLPIVRSIISIPAGFAEMALGKFVIYSATGSLLFTTSVAALVYYIGTTEGPIQFLIAWGWETLLAYPIIVTIGIVIITLLALVGWRKYGQELMAQMIIDA